MYCASCIAYRPQVKRLQNGLQTRIIKLILGRQVQHPLKSLPVKSAGPCLQGPSGCEAYCCSQRTQVTSIMYLTGLHFDFIADSNQRFLNNCYWITYRSAFLCFKGLQVSKLRFTGLLLYPLECHFTLHQVRVLNLGCLWCDSEIHRKLSLRSFPT